MLGKGEVLIMNNFELIQGILSEELAMKPELITRESRLVEDLSVDSVTMMVIVSAIQDEKDIEVSDEMIKSVKTVGDIVDYLDNNA